ncbi:transglycosylase SLT domain-containing protein [Marinicella meishanensis]|uniref:transglycosylase SLT domain-containing protein n=1 Tax=Marinicella meishanensis TaxID=2873263 RepID=UPI001CBDA2D8|nr:transglycosylase SLT domain-containing protein [Marinicella sp. NBU2979]
MGRDSHHKRHRLLITAALLAWCLAGWAQTDQQRQLFRQLYALALNGDASQVAQRRAPLDNYPITHYLDYALIRHDMHNLPEQAVADFAQQHPDSPLNKQLKEYLLDHLGQQQQWAKYLQYHNGFDRGKRQCWYLRARIQQQQLKGLAPLVETMWMSGLSAPDACDFAFKWWQAEGHLTDQKRLKRIQLAFESNNMSLVNHLRTQLRSQPVWVKQAMDLLQDPIAALGQASSWPPNPELPWLLHKTGMRAAKKMPAQLHPIWPQIKAAHKLPQAHIDQVERQMALFAATDYEPFSIDAMKRLPAGMKDDQIHAWIVRYYLYHEQWADVLDALKKMSLRQLSQDRWQYWTARALAKLGQPDEAKKIFTNLSRESNYYGFLAADHLRQPYHLCHQPVSSSLAAFNPPLAIVRAIELHHAGLLYKARREWNTAYKGLNKDQKIALAERVLQEHWYAKSIAIMADLGHWENYHSRYPVAHEQIIRQETSNDPLPQWVMAIIKQESAWTKDAVSHANAHGLMQLLPSTARSVASQLGLTVNQSRDLHQAPLNIKLGVQYQKNLFKQFDHPILVAAAYNAGERKSLDWSQDFPQSPDLWLETIPYRETRDYITRILSNVTIYDWLINQTPRRITSWMPTLPINQSPSRAWPNKTTPQQTTQAVCLP